MPTKLKASDLTRSLTDKHKFIPLLEQSIGKSDHPWTFEYEPKGSDDAWHPSGDCTPPLKTLFLSAKERLDPDVSRPSVSLSLRKTFMVGHFWHQWLQFHAVLSGIADKTAIERSHSKGWGGQEPWKPFNWVRGSADIAPAVLDDEKWVIDFKTMNATDFALDTPPTRFDFDKKWECQINVYMDFFDYDKACIIGIDKLTGSMKEFVYYRNEDLIDAIYHKWKIVSYCLNEDIEPPEGEDIDLPFKGVSE